jgi:hypothetical protein
MTDPIAFPSSTSHFGLPLLFAGQAQKEFFVNQALVVLDALSQRAVIETRADPPTSQGDGDCYRVAGSATGAWDQQVDKLAISVGGSWHFVAPEEGMMLFDRAAGQWLWFRSGWRSAPAPSLPTGGAVIDTEARTLLVQVVAMLQSSGLLAPTPI